MNEFEGHTGVRKLVIRLMGIRGLNRYLKTCCRTKQSIQSVSFAALRGKRVVVDVTVYLYKCASNEYYLENLFVMLSVFRKYNMCPLFVFDGKSPQEKGKVIEHRRDLRCQAQHALASVSLAMEHATDPDEWNALHTQRAKWAKQAVFLTRHKIQLAKEMIACFGMKYYQCAGEADNVCAYLVRSGKMWGCMSEDMDMFAYGCPHVIRNVRFENETAELYHTDSILSALQLSQLEFTQICIAAGTDYTEADAHSLVPTMFHLHHQHRRRGITVSFLEWVQTQQQQPQSPQLLATWFRALEIFQGHWMHVEDTQAMLDITCDIEKGTHKNIQQYLEQHNTVIVF